METIGFIFGGKSAEHEVSVITAMQIISAYTKEECNVLPIFLDKSNNWFVFDVKKVVLSDFAREKLDAKIFLPVRLDKGEKCLILQRGKRAEKIKLDACVNLCHGGLGENGQLVGEFEACGIPISSGDSIGLGVAFDKVLSKFLCAADGIPVLPCVWFFKDEWENVPTKIISELNRMKFPLIVKPARQGSSIGISRVNNATELVSAVRVAFEFDNKVLVEHAIENAREFNCSALGMAGDDVMISDVDEPIKKHQLLSFEDKYIGDAKGAGLINNGDGKGAGDARGSDLACGSTGAFGEKTVSVGQAKNDDGGGAKAANSSGGIKGGALSASGGRTYLKDAKLAKKVRELTAQAFRLHGLRGVCRVDFLFDPKRKKLYLNEINTIPGSLAFYFWTRAGMSTTAFVDRLIEIAKTANARKAELKDEYITKLLK